MLLISEILDEIDWRVFKLKGVHRPRVSTKRGKKDPPTATTRASCRMSLNFLLLQLLHQHDSSTGYEGKQETISYHQNKKTCLTFTKVWGKLRI